MSEKIIKIEFTESIKINQKLDKDNQFSYKYELLERIKEILNIKDLDYFLVGESEDNQEIVLKINNKKSDQ